MRASFPGAPTNYDRHFFLSCPFPRGQRFCEVQLFERLGKKHGENRSFASDLVVFLLIHPERPSKTRKAFQDTFQNKTNKESNKQTKKETKKQRNKQGEWGPAKSSRRLQRDWQLQAASGALRSATKATTQAGSVGSQEKINQTEQTKQKPKEKNSQQLNFLHLLEDS